jgi:hypothetical protein
MGCVRFIFIWSVVLLVSLRHSYGNHSPSTAEKRSTEFAIFEENGKVGLKDAQGEVLIPATYEAIGWSNGKLSIVDRVVGYRSGGMWGLIHTSNRVVTPAEYLDLRPGEASFIVAQKKSSLSQRPSFGVLNTSGKTVIPFLYDGLQLASMRAIVMSRNGTRYQFGLIDLAHRMLIPVAYQRISSLGSLRYAVENFDNKTAIFSDAGTRLTAFNIDSISTFKKDYAIIYQDQKQGLIDRNGETIVKPTCGAVHLLDDGTIKIRDTHEWFFLQGDNKLIRTYKADGLSALSANHYAVVMAGKLQLANNELKPLHADFFSSLSNFENGIALYRKTSHTGVIDNEGNVVIPPLYEQLIVDGKSFRARLDIAGKNRWVILDSHAKQLTEKMYEEIGPFNGKFYPVKNRGYWGAVNTNGDEIITCVHDSLVQESNDNVVVRFKGQYGVINLEERWMVTPQPHFLKVLNDGAYLEFSDKTTFLKTFSGDIIYFSDNPLEYDNGYLREELSSGAHWLINMDGIIIDRSNQPVMTDIILPPTEGLQAIRKDGKFGFIDDVGRLRIANRYEEARPFNEGLAAIRIRGKWGFIDHQERLVIQPVYEQTQDFNNGKAIVKMGGLSGLIDVSGKMIIPVRYDEVILNDKGRFTVRQDKMFGLADASGIIINPRYDAIVDCGNDYVIVERGGKFGVLTLRGVSTIPMIYDGLTFDGFHNHFLAVKKSRWETFKTSSSTAQAQ